jgi:hypothetical protein
MPDLSDNYHTAWPANPTWAEPISDAPLGDIFSAAERAQRLGDNIVSEAAAREKVYDRRIEAVRQATGVTLENPERGGYGLEARGHLREDMRNGDLSPIDEKAGVAPYRRRVFDRKVADLQATHPVLEFGDIDEEAHALGAQARQDVARAGLQDVNPVLGFGAGMLGTMWGSRRDPMVLASLFAGPSTAIGKLALARVATSALGQGFYNAGITALEQPAVQDWHAKIGMETGIKPALQDVGMAFLAGMIPGAAIEGTGIAIGKAAPALKRLMRGEPEPGDAAKVTEALAPDPASVDARAMQAGEESVVADRAVLTERPPATAGQEAPPPLEPVRTAEAPPLTAAAGAAAEPPAVPEAAPRVEPAAVPGEPPLTAAAGAAATDTRPLHDDLVAAALKRADDPEAPSPQAVAAIEPGGADPELQARIEQANPRTPEEAMAAADEALDDFGRRDGMADLMERMRAAREEEEETTRQWLGDETAAKPEDEDIMNRVPMMRNDGTVELRSEQAVRRDGNVEDLHAELVRSCTDG